MKTAKLGALFLISIMALAGVGAGYAAWTDTITIDGSVNTGSVGWKFTAYSGTWVYKDTVEETCIESDVELDLTLPKYANYILVAYSKAEQGIDGDHHATFTFDNLFPCIDFMADVWITYTGTVPGKISTITVRDFWPDTADEHLIDPYTRLDVTIYDAAGGVVKDWQDIPFDPSIFCGWQLHLGYKIYIVMTIHLEQLDILMDLDDCGFDMDIEVIQWNKYVP